MDYKESIEYLLRFADYERLPRSGIVWDLKRIERLMTRLDNPHLDAKTVHITGTRGKGSTAAMIASILKNAGYKVGLYTSPHLLSYTERIQFDGKPIPEKEWAKLVEIIKPHVEAENAIGDLGQLTTFEIFTAMAFLHFRRVKADWQVMEVGLGGRLDATNIVKPEVCVLTSISYEHMDVLGHTLTQIAREKSGIIKPGAEVVTAPQFPEALTEIERVCKEKGVRLIKVGRDVTWQKGSFNEGGQNFRVKGMRGKYDLRIPLLGEHQMENASNAVAAIELLVGKGVKVTTQNIVEGLAKVDWPGRLQIMGRNPWVVVDGAQNAYSMKRLGEALKEYFTYRKATLILGFGADKDISGMAAEAVKTTRDIILAKSQHPRAVKAADLAAEFQKHGVTPKTAENVKDAVKMALGAAGADDLICAAGSLFVVAEVMELMGS
jgi:dihydrofolate synthase/folylpolyglutamate synthase